MLKTLKPRVRELTTSRVKPAPNYPGMTDRLRGGAGMARRAQWLRSQPLCVTCERLGFVTPADEVDHVVPLWAGGLDDESNLQSLCRDCHASKTAAEQRERGPQRAGW